MAWSVICIGMLGGCAAHQQTTQSASSSSTYPLQPFECKGTLDDVQDSPTMARTGKVVIGLAGDSTVTYNVGYAAGFRSHFDTRAQIINLSRGGRTTATFRSDGRWKQMMAYKPDYVLIQFGHNDEKVMNTLTYSQNLAAFVDEAREAGGIPILVTPVSRRYWRADGKIHSDLFPFADAMKKVAADKGVTLIDLHSRAIELYEQVGKPVTDSWSPRKPSTKQAASGPSTMPATVIDNTHFNAEGSKAMGKLVAEELAKAVPSLAQYIH